MSRLKTSPNGHQQGPIRAEKKGEDGIISSITSRITVRACPEIHNLVASPRDAKIRPDSVPAAQFSIQYTVAAALVRGDLFLKELEAESLRDETILDLARRVYVEPDPALRTDFVLGRTIMEIEQEGHPPFRAEIDLPLGNPSRPMDYQACAEKFLKCAQYSVRPLERGRLLELIEMVSRLEDQPDASILVRYLA